VRYTSCKKSETEGEQKKEEEEAEAEAEEENVAEEEGGAEGEEETTGGQDVESWNAGRKALAYNPHFPNSNQTKHCWSSYVNYHQCVKLKGAGDAECNEFQSSALMLCPSTWLNKWDEEREEGKFASPYDQEQEQEQEQDQDHGHGH